MMRWHSSARIAFLVDIESFKSSEQYPLFVEAEAVIDTDLRLGMLRGLAVAAILDDASVVLSVALQFGIPAADLARSVARLPAVPLAPPYLDQPGDSREKRPAAACAPDMPPPRRAKLR